MTTATVRKIPMLARKIQRISPCCCMRTTIRFRSSFATVTNPLEWDTSPSPSYLPRILQQQQDQQPQQQQHLPQQQLQEQHHNVSPLDSLTIPSTLLNDPDAVKRKRKSTIPSKTKAPKIKTEKTAKTVKAVKTTETAEIAETAETAEAAEAAETGETAKTAKTEKPVDTPNPQQVDIALRTYQGHSLATYQTHFPELEPAPFPKDIHTSMPYMNRNITKPGTSRSGSTGSVHNNLQSFEGLEHNMDSTLYRGTRFEYQTQEVLRKTLGIYTQRSAGNGDLGVDLRGTWFLPLSASPKQGDMVRHLKVIVQCKMMTSKIGPKFVRELQGSLSFETQPTMAILAVSSEYTKQALLPYAKSLWPMALVVIDTKAEECIKLMWNRAAEKVMHGLQVGTRWMPGANGGLDSRPVLCFEGKVLERLPGPYLSKGRDSTGNDSKTQVVDYAIPDWNIITAPDCIHVFPEATGGDGRRLVGQDVEEDRSTSPAQSSYLELLTWHPPSLPPLEQLNESLS